MSKRLQVAIAIGVIATCGRPLLAWDHFGHMVVAGVAYRNLEPQTRSKVDALLTRNPYYAQIWPSLIPSRTARADRTRMIFMLAATWPDRIKRDPKYHDDGADNGDRPTGPEPSRNTGYDDFNRHKYWHFVDNPFSQDGTGISSVLTPTPNVRTQIGVFRQVLRSASSDDLKSYDLTWLLHLIGDVHQPLHAATRVSASDPQGDAGGNNVIFCKPQANPCSEKLHKYWDDILGTNANVAAADQYAAMVVAPTLQAGSVGDAGTWIAESFKLAQTNVYVTPVLSGDGPFHATAAYASAARALARKRVALAGARLAAVLNTDLK